MKFLIVVVLFLLSVLPARPVFSSTSDSCVSFVSHRLYFGSNDFNSRGEVSKLQRFLTAQGFYKGKTNGVFDSATGKAMLSFDRRYGLLPAGSLSYYAGLDVSAKRFIRWLTCPTPVVPRTAVITPSSPPASVPTLPPIEYYLTPLTLPLSPPLASRPSGTPPVPKLHVLYSNGFEYFNTGAEIATRWESTNYPPEESVILSVIKLNPDYTQTQSIALSIVTANDGSEPIVLPFDEGTYFLRLSCFDVLNVLSTSSPSGCMSDDSDGYFQVSFPPPDTSAFSDFFGTPPVVEAPVSRSSFTLTMPKGGEIFAYRDMLEIVWLADHLLGLRRIALVPYRYTPGRTDFSIIDKLFGEPVTMGAKYRWKVNDLPIGLYNLVVAVEGETGEIIESRTDLPILIQKVNLIASPPASATIISNLTRVVRQYFVSSSGFNPTVHGDFDFDDNMVVGRRDLLALSSVGSLPDAVFYSVLRKLTAAVDSRLNLREGDLNYVPEFDINGNNFIDMIDLDLIRRALIGDRQYDKALEQQAPLGTFSSNWRIFVGGLANALSAVEYSVPVFPRR